MLLLIMSILQDPNWHFELVLAQIPQTIYLAYRALLKIFTVLLWPDS